jgi:hypothetical protein
LAVPQAPNVDGVLITWGDRLFYPGNRIVKAKPQPRLGGGSPQLHAAAIRQRIEATVVRRAPQVMVKVNGGGRGMKAIAAYFRYISKNGRLVIEDQRGESMRGKDSLRDLAEEWRLGGTLIPNEAAPTHRREAFNLTLSMPRGTAPQSVLQAAREFAQAELHQHKYVMVLHDHQAHPHVHLSVRAESTVGRRLCPRMADLYRWRDTFAAKLRGLGIEAEATRQATRGCSQNYEPLWRRKARKDGQLRDTRPTVKTGAAAVAKRADAAEAWSRLSRGLAMSSDPADQDLARSINQFVREMQADQRIKARAVAPQAVQRVGPADLERGR